MKVLILCGGLGTRLAEETALKPKPMVQIGQKPILWHLIKYFKYYGLSDFVLATGKSFTVRKFVEDAFKCIDVEIIWRGKSLNEVGIDKKTKNVLVKIDKRLFRPNEVNFLKGNNMKAKKILKWTPKINYIKLVKEMVASDLENLSS